MSTETTQQCLGIHSEIDCGRNGYARNGYGPKCIRPKFISFGRADMISVFLCGYVEDTNTGFYSTGREALFSLNLIKVS